MNLQTVIDFRNKKRVFAELLREAMTDANMGRLTAGELAEYRRKLPEWQSAMNRFNQVESVILAAEKVVGPMSDNQGQLRGLGALPFAVPAAVVAAVAGATYLLSKTLTELSQFLQRRSYIKQRASEGVDAAQAMAEYTRNNPKDAGLFGDMSKLMWPLAIVVGGVLILGAVKR
jgi:hypothetical protein